MIFGPLALTASLLLSLGDARGGLLAPRELTFPFDDGHLLAPGDSHAGKLWRSHGLPDDGSAVPLVVFMHGIIFDGRKYHWLSTDSSGPYDARAFVSQLVEEGAIAPLVLAAPSQVRDGTDPGKLFTDLDFDAFVDEVDRQLAPLQRVDRERIVVIGHSGAACGLRSGAFAALTAATFRPRLLLAIDGCLSAESAELLGGTSGAADVVVAYQDSIWERDFADFSVRFARRLGGECGAAASGPSWSCEGSTGIRVFERYGEIHGPQAHLQLVQAAMTRWLPRALPPPFRPVSPLSLLIDAGR
jgi:hypothetical protein